MSHPLSTKSVPVKPKPHTGGRVRVGAIERIRRRYAQGPTACRCCLTLSWLDVAELRLLLASRMQPTVGEVTSDEDGARQRLGG